MKKTIAIEENILKTLFKAHTEFLKIYENAFGKDYLSGKVIDKITCYADACIVNGETSINVLEMRENGFTDDEIIYRQLKAITKAINKGRMPNMLDTSEKKWFPVFKVEPASPSGFVFYFSAYDDAGACAGCASRLCFLTEADSDYAGKTFTDLYSKYII